MAEYTPAELLQQEKEVSGLYLSGHPLDAYREKSARIGSHTIKDLTGEDAHVPVSYIHLDVYKRQWSHR